MFISSIIYKIHSEIQTTSSIQWYPPLFGFFYNLVRAQRGELPDYLMRFTPNDLGTFYHIGPETPRLTINNMNENLNKVLDGTDRMIAVDTSKMKSGYTYEIAYSVLDFEGNISTSKYYVKIAE